MIDEQYIEHVGKSGFVGTIVSEHLSGVDVYTIFVCVFGVANSEESVAGEGGDIGICDSGVVVLLVLQREQQHMCAAIRDGVEPVLLLRGLLA